MNSQKYKRGQIWWYNGSGGIGDEKSLLNSKVRPMLIVSNDVQNRFSNTVIAIPLTTAEKKDYPTHTKFNINGRLSTFLAENIRSCNKEYFTYYIETIDDELMACIEENIRIALGFNLISDNIKLKELEINEPEVNVVTPVVDDNNLLKRGRKRATLEDKIRFINDYENHDVDYMLKKYKIKNKQGLHQKVYMYRKAIKENP